MKINVAKSSGFCFGVRKAIDMSLALEKSEKPVYVLGDIVHNRQVVNDLNSRGIQKISNIQEGHGPRAPGPGHQSKGTLIISAHGTAKKTFEEAKEAGFDVTDATCPKVTDIYDVGRELEKDHTIIIIGDKGHTEVKGIVGQLETEPVIIHSKDNLPKEKLSKIKKAAVITQSTQSQENVNEIFEELEKIMPDVKLYDTTCGVTNVKQRDIVKLAKENDVVLIVGSNTSANTMRLHQTSKKINDRSYWIETRDDLEKNWFLKDDNVGIMAGASTPDETVDGIEAKLRELFG